MKIWSFTFGCKVNQYETELLRHRLTGSGDVHVQRIEDADLCLINSCSVTSFADRECRKLIRRVLRSNPRARTIVTGCYATRAPEEITKISNRIEIYSNQQKEDLPSCVGFEVSQKPLGIHQFSGRTRAFLKIQDGCRAPCNYCIIPTVRPDMWSKPLPDVLSELEALLNNGYQEIVLTGIRLGLYRGSDGLGGKVDLLGLLKKMVLLNKKFRIRLSSLEVTEVTDRLISFVANEPKICRHFHIPLQSGHSEVLKSMQRWYDLGFYQERVRTVRQFLPDCGITADVMVGYPTETENQFLEACQSIENMELSGLHVFRFSPREGTPASRLKPLAPSVVSHRADVLGQLDQVLRERFYRKFEGSERECLPEPNGEGWTDNYIRVELPLAEVKKGLSLRRVESSQFGRKEIGMVRV
ncbi:MAG: Threonylcarbamoyladenosine tRNA methylthiotransferase MtaB [Elusimicrobia bacterium]|nr:Threonylcarbamoyladenosine tRNA methylthiotransferase MtaB [Elusimicrobiota bacterium]